MSGENPAVYCRDQVRRFDHDRYLTVLFAPPYARARLFALYAFNLEIARVREAVREPMIGQIRLQWWRDALDEMAQGSVRQHPVALYLAAAIESAELPRAMFDRLLEAREFDLAGTPPADLAALEHYADSTSATLMALAAAALGAGGPAVEAATHHVGIGFALVGLLRAVPFHARQRRLYLPADRLYATAIDVEALFAGRASPALARIAQEIGARAGEHLALARRIRREVPRAAVPALLPAIVADIYLARLARCGYALFDPTILRPAGSRALRLAIASLLGRY
ncbi:MAG TPA: squalene/phytoene synthase family protein [Alphaproteobacteria bacterium]|nr:squalene/phytoene synthase family protein [Alphaproteobacteria bacterium]